ncbi:MAG: hypothetical protein LBR23_05205 [Spirochaetaceae bacterium]|jgi:hypothetical protein|nr:hypothetical protein [Spirochaetaceae bacterium]
MKRFACCVVFLLAVLPSVRAEMNEPRRAVEAGIDLRSVNIGNNWFPIKNLLFPQDGVLVVDFYKMASVLTDGFKIDGTLDATPFFFNINVKKILRLGVSANVTGSFGLTVPRDTLDFLAGYDSDGTASAGAQVYGSAFADLSLSVGTFIRNFGGRAGGDLGITLIPSVFLPLMKVTPGSSIEYTMDRDGVSAMTDISAYVIDYGSVTNLGDAYPLMGFDISFAMEYPLSSKVDIALGVKHIPIRPGTLTKKAALGDGQTNRVSGEDLIAGEVDGLLPDFENIAFETADLQVSRPIEAGLSVSLRPLSWFSLLPSINLVFDEPFFFEYSLGTEIHWKKWISATLSTNYEDRIFVQRLQLGFNLRLLEVDLAVQSSSSNFLRSFLLTGAGFGVAFKFGW